MSAQSTSLRAGLAGKPYDKTTQRLRRVRRTCLALAAACAIILPFEAGVLAPPDLSAIDLSGLPYIGKYFPQPAAPVLHNSRRTVMPGQVERFSITVPRMPHMPFTYVLQYANGHKLGATVESDARGFSSYTFHITYRPHHFRETAVIRVYDAAGRLRAYTRFAVQAPARRAHGAPH